MPGSYDIGQLPVGTILRINSGAYQYLVSFTPYLMLNEKTIQGVVVINTNDIQLIDFLATKQVQPAQVGISRVLWGGGGFLLHFGEDVFHVKASDTVFKVIDGVEKRLI
jgi:hypothetical protein